MEVAPPPKNFCSVHYQTPCITLGNIFDIYVTLTQLCIQIDVLLKMFAYFYPYKLIYLIKVDLKKCFPLMIN